jgi:hypothetical protein
MSDIQKPPWQAGGAIANPKKGREPAPDFPARHIYHNFRPMSFLFSFISIRFVLYCAALDVQNSVSHRIRDRNPGLLRDFTSVRLAATAED